MSTAPLYFLGGLVAAGSPAALMSLLIIRRYHVAYETLPAKIDALRIYVCVLAAWMSIVLLFLALMARSLAGAK